MKTLAGLALLLMAVAFRFAPTTPSDLPPVLSPTFRKDTLTISTFGAVPMA